VFSPPEASRGKPMDDDTSQPAGLAENDRPTDKNETANEGQTADKDRPADQNGTADEGRPTDEDGTADENGEPDSGPIYVWNPSASTESFPIVPRDR